MPRMLLIASTTVVLALLAACGGGGGAGEADFTVPEDYPYPVLTPELLEDRTHMQIGEVFDGYTSDPPTSGPHTGVPANWGISSVVLAKEVPVHNMEHAGVTVWYNCDAGLPLTPDECTGLQNALGAVVQPLAASGTRVLLTAYPSMESRIALTSWGFLDAFDEFDADRVQFFIDTFECNYDPESFCG